MFSDAMFKLAMKTMDMNGCARPMAKWKSCGIYEQLVAEGYAAEVTEDNPFFRRFELTDAGRDAMRRAVR